MLPSSIHFEPNPKQFPKGEVKIHIAGSVGVLEAMTHCPETLSVPAVAVICHPHPLMRGTLHNKVVHTLAKTFRDMGLCAVRFNFRGVGESEGEYAQGIGETEDALAVLRWVKGVCPEAAIWLAGFSFGAYVALRAASVWPVAQLVTIAPPIGHFNVSDIVLPSCPWLVIQGDHDEVIDPDRVFAWVASLQSPPQLIRMEGAGHFFHGRLIELRRVIQTALAGRLSL